MFDPLVRFVPGAGQFPISVPKFLSYLALLERLHATDDVQHIVSDRLLTSLVQLKRQVINKIVRSIGRVLHGDHTC